MNWYTNILVKLCIFFEENRGSRDHLIHIFRMPSFQLMLGLILFVRKMLLRCRFHWHDRGPLFISPYNTMGPFQRWLWFYFPKTTYVSRWETESARTSLTVSWWYCTLGEFHLNQQRHSGLSNLSNQWISSLYLVLQSFLLISSEALYLNYQDTYPL